MPFWMVAIKGVLKKVSGGASLTEPDMEKISQVYQNVGGSWVKLAQGSPDSWNLLKDVCWTYTSAKKELEKVSNPNG